MAAATLIVLSNSISADSAQPGVAANPDDAGRADSANGADFALALDLLCTAAMKWHRQLVMVAALLVCARAHADRRPRPALLSVEAQAGGGVAMGAGTAGPTVWRVAPVTLSLVLDYAIIAKPWVSVFGGVRGETLGRAGVGAIAGLRVRPTRGPLRIGAGLVTILFPYSITGIAAHIGACPKLGRSFRACVDGEVTAYLFGGDLPPGRVATQLSLMVGAAFDAL
jgi:hypothetical protein